MIICYPLNIIFVETYKTGGTAFEVSLSQFCDNRCSITPLDAEGERIKKDLGFRTSQNWNQAILYDGCVVKGSLLGNFTQHTSAKILQKVLPPRFKIKFRKITVIRNTYERIISRYQWDVSVYRDTPVNIFEYIEKNRDKVLENFNLINPNIGFIDNYIEYGDVNNIKFLPVEFHNTYNSVFPKKLQKRKNNWVRNFYQNKPGLARLVTKILEEEIETFGFKPPV